jgi:hypothetical protein
VTTRSSSPLRKLRPILKRSVELQKDNARNTAISDHGGQGVLVRLDDTVSYNALDQIRTYLATSYMVQRLYCGQFVREERFALLDKTETARVLLSITRDTSKAWAWAPDSSTSKELYPGPVGTRPDATDFIRKGTRSLPGSRHANTTWECPQ